MRYMREIVRANGSTEGRREIKVQQGAPLDVMMGEFSGAIRLEVTYRDGSVTIYTKERSPDEPCQRGTVGCSVDHKHIDSSCETY